MFEDIIDWLVYMGNSNFKFFFFYSLLRKVDASCPGMHYVLKWQMQMMNEYNSLIKLTLNLYWNNNPGEIIIPSVT